MTWFTRPECDVTVVASFTFNITVKDTEDGEVKIDNDSPGAGENVTITVTPDEGKEIAEVIVMDENGNKIAVTDNGNNTYTYLQPDSDVTIEVIFRNIQSPGSVDPSGNSSEGTTANAASLATGDHAPVALWSVVLLAAAGILIALLGIVKRYNR